VYYEVFKDYMFDNSIEKTFHYCKHGLYLCMKVKKVTEIHNGEGLELDCHGAVITVWNDSRVIKCTRPPNVVKECKNCFQVCNEYDEPIGYIYN
jgi:hypothetical protein